MTDERLRADARPEVSDAATVSEQTARPRPGRLGREGLIAKFNQAVRRPADHGGLSVLPLLLDLIAEASRLTEGTVWIPDGHERLSTAPLVRDHFADPAIHVTASQYGEDAYRHSWLHLDRPLTAADHSVLLDRAPAWADTDRTVHDVLDAFGPASVTFGDPEPHRAKTLGYGCGDAKAPFVVFHFAPAADEPAATQAPSTLAAAPLLAVRNVYGGYLDLQLTPYGRAVCWPDRERNPRTRLDMLPR
ncbi:hypothetical protein [Streptacidiphilus rugosus]|uniref:hypothetical protein n=1 Tax=Streptacidiphilus rugosus TaxID=405783 RepID=UPI00068A5824|nr:hypothetical protein [Streptacidiphilus rugosus]